MRAVLAGVSASICVALAGCGGGAETGDDGARLPSEDERGAITAALPGYIRDIPAGCVWLDERVSDDAAYATVVPTFLSGARPGSRCARFASNGFFVLRKTARWRVVYNGSDPPPESLGVPAELRDELGG